MEEPTDHLTHAHILLGEEQKKQLRFWAADRNTSMAALVREAVDFYLRVAVGPSPQQVRIAARHAVGALPLNTSPSADLPGAGPSYWHGGGD